MIEDSSSIDLGAIGSDPLTSSLLFLSLPSSTKNQITCGSELAAGLLEDYEKDGIKLPGDVKASPSGQMLEQTQEGPPAAVARLLRILDAFASSSSPPSAAPSSAPCSSSSARPDATSSLVAAARFASAATKWAAAAGGGKELLGKLHLACAAALSAVAAASSCSSSSGTAAAAWGAAAPHWARASAAAPETVAEALDAVAREGEGEGERSDSAKERSAFLARAALAQVAARCGSSPHEAADAVRGAQQLAEEFRKLGLRRKAKRTRLIISSTCSWRACRKGPHHWRRLPRGSTDRWLKASRGCLIALMRPGLRRSRRRLEEEAAEEGVEEAREQEEASAI